MTTQDQPQALCPNNGQPCKNTACACPATPSAATLNRLDSEEMTCAEDCQCSCEKPPVGYHPV